MGTENSLFLLFATYFCRNKLKNVIKEAIVRQSSNRRATMSRYNGDESETLEFKEAYTDTICKEIVSFLNANGGDIVLGVDNDGNIVGIKKMAMFYQSVDF